MTVKPPRHFALYFEFVFFILHKVTCGKRVVGSMANSEVEVA